MSQPAIHLNQPQTAVIYKVWMDGGMEQIAVNKSSCYHTLMMVATDGRMEHTDGLVQDWGNSQSYTKH